MKMPYTPQQILNFYPSYNYITCDKLNNKLPVVMLWKEEPKLTKSGAWWFEGEATFSNVTPLNRPDVVVDWGNLKRFNKRIVER